MCKTLVEQAWVIWRTLEKCPKSPLSVGCNGEDVSPIEGEKSGLLRSQSDRLNKDSRVGMSTVDIYLEIHKNGALVNLR